MKLGSWKECRANTYCSSVGTTDLQGNGSYRLPIIFPIQKQNGEYVGKRRAQQTKYQWSTAWNVLWPLMALFFIKHLWHELGRWPTEIRRQKRKRRLMSCFKLISVWSSLPFWLIIVHFSQVNFAWHWLQLSAKMHSISLWICKVFEKYKLVR